MILKRLFQGLLILLSSLTLGIVFIIGYIQMVHVDEIKSIEQLKPAPIAIILGASINANKTPSDALRDRLMTGIELYRRGLVQKLLMTGDDGGNKHNEVEVMRTFALEQGIPGEAIIVDPHGYRTYESCKNASETFNIDQAIVVTQRFHLARSLYLCEHFGVESQGIPADLQSYAKIRYFWLRDLASSFKAWWDVTVQASTAPY